MSVGMAVDDYHEIQKQELAALLNRAADIAERIGLWVMGQEASDLFRQIGEQLQEAARAYCIADGCGLEFDPADAERSERPTLKPGETLRPWFKHYCPKHRVIKG